MTNYQKIMLATSKLAMKFVAKNSITFMMKFAMHPIEDLWPKKNTLKLRITPRTMENTRHFEKRRTKNTLRGLIEF